MQTTIDAKNSSFYPGDISEQFDLLLECQLLNKIKRSPYFHRKARINLPDNKGSIVQMSHNEAMMKLMETKMPNLQGE